MSKAYTRDQRFEGNDFSEEPLPKGEYDNCTFVRCVFAHADLSDRLFADCTFENCDLSMARMRNTTLRDVTFDGCKLLGLRFDECNPFLLAFSFESCILDFSSFFRLKLKKTAFRNCRLLEVEFVETDLAGSTFAGSDLSGAVFEKTILEACDFRTAVNYTIHPATNRIAKAKFALAGLPGLLQQFRIVIE